MDSRRNVTSSVDGTGTTIGFRDGGARMAERSRSDALVGRQHELAALRGVVDRAAQGSGGAVVVLGEAEIGKSRLLAEVARRAAAQGMQVLAGTAVPGGGLGLLAADRGVWADRVDAVAVLRVDLAEHERAGDPRLARTCRDLLRRAGAPTRRGRGATPSRRRCGRPG
jgi:AAA ATPase domain